jgi:LysM repeat protein
MLKKPISPWKLLVNIILAANVMIFLIVITVITLPLRITAATTAAQTAPQGSQASFAKKPALPQLISVASNLPVATSQAATDISSPAETDALLEPPVVDQGGTCIEGSIIDTYEIPRGGGWVITITPATGGPETKPANPNGNFLFVGLGAGTYTVELKFPEGWRPYTPAVFKVTLNGVSPECAEVRFKMEALANLEVTKLDNGGSLSFKERVGIPGWPITITSGATTLTQETNGEGKAYFRNLPPGTWIVQEASKTGWCPAHGYPATLTIELVSPREPDSFQSAVFVNEQCKGYIRVVKKDVWDRPVADWRMVLTRDDGTQPSRPETTRANGEAYFLDLEPGTWTVTEESRSPWWRPINPPNGQSKVTIGQPGEGREAIFINEPLGCVDGYKINDLEQGLSGWQIKAHNAGTGEEQATVTDATGYFRFYLSLGTWTLTEIMQNGWSAVTPSEFSVDVTRLFECEHVRFKNRTNFACVDVYKKDVNGDVGLPGWTITVAPAYDGANARPKSGVTDGTGWVRFNELAPGDYVISEAQQSGWLPAGPTSIKIKLEASGACSVVTFHNYQASSPVAPRDAPGNTSGCITHYTVRPGDTLFRIALRFRVAWPDLAKANGLTGTIIHPNTALCIPP